MSERDPLNAELDAYRETLPKLEQRLDDLERQVTELTRLLIVRQSPSLRGPVNGPGFNYLAGKWPRRGEDQYPLNQQTYRSDDPNNPRPPFQRA